MISHEVLSSFVGKKILVTGGTGLIGRQVVDILASSGSELTSVSLDDLELNENVKYLNVDLSSFENCCRITEGMDCVFHIAGVKGSVVVTKKHPANFFVPLLMMNTNVLEACRLNKVDKVVYVSSIGAYSVADIFCETQKSDAEPMDSFPGWAKRMAEKQIEAYRIQYNLDNYAIVRPCNVYGPGDNFDSDNAMVIPSLMSRILAGEDPLVVWGDGSVIRDFAYSRDVAEGIILALYHGTSPGFVNLGSGFGVTIRELVDTLSSFIDFSYEFDSAKASGFSKRVMDISHAQEHIDYSPSMSLLAGLKETWQWFIDNQDEHLYKKNYFKEET